MSNGIVHRPRAAVFFLPSDEISGVTRVNLGLAAVWSRQGVDCTFWWTDPFRECPMFELEGVPVLSPIKPQSSAWLGSRSIGYVKALRHLHRTLWNRLGEMTDTWVFPGYDIGSAYAWPFPGKGNRVLFVVHSDDPFYYRALDGNSSHADAIVCVSRYLESAVKGRFPQLGDRLACVPNGILLKSGFADPIPEPGATLRMVYAGRIEQVQKQVLRIPEILRLLDARKVSYRMEWIGDGPELEALKALCATEFPSSRCVFHGRCGHRETLEIIQQSDVFLSVSAYEGMSMSLLEGLAMGCIPVVSKIRSGNDEVLAWMDCGHQLDRESPHAYADVLEGIAKMTGSDRGMLREGIRLRFQDSPFTAERMALGYGGLAFSGSIPKPRNALRFPRNLSWRSRLSHLFSRRFAEF